MTSVSITIPPLPEKIHRQAKAAFGSENRFLQIGDRLPEILRCKEISVSVATEVAATDNYLRSIPCLSLVTILQYEEGMTDEQVSNAVRTRLDWKYALHLPQWFLGIEEKKLCKFRRSLYHSLHHYRVFTLVRNRMEQAGFLPSETGLVDEHTILSTVCIQNRLRWLSVAFSLSLGALAATDTGWLRQNSLSHWYFRYGNITIPDQSVKTLTEKTNALLAVGSDAQDLLQKAGDPARFAGCEELLALRGIYDQHFEQKERMRSELRPRCSFCSPPGSL